MAQQTTAVSRTVCKESSIPIEVLYNKTINTLKKNFEISKIPEPPIYFKIADEGE